MKELISNIWGAPASTVAGAIVAALTALGSTWLNAPLWVTITVATLSAFIGAFSGIKK